MSSVDAYAERLTQTNTELGHLRRERSEAQGKLKLLGRQIERQERIRASMLKKLGGS